MAWHGRVWHGMVGVWHGIRRAGRDRAWQGRGRAWQGRGRYGRVVVWQGRAGGRVGYCKLREGVRKGRVGREG